MAQFNNMFYVDLSGQNAPVMLRQMIGEGNNSANKIGAIVKNNGTDVQLNGSCKGRVIRADGVTVLIDGVISGNTAYIVLDGESYAVPGQIDICVNWVNGNEVTTLVKAYGTVERTATGQVIPSGNPIDIDEIIALLEDITNGNIFCVDSTIITGDGTTSAIANHDSVQPNTLYRLQLTTKMSWLPSDYPTDASIHYLIDIKHDFNAYKGITELIFTESMVPVWIRMAQPSQPFGNWSVVDDGVTALAEIAFKSDTTIINGDGTASAIANHDNVKGNTLYRLQVTTKMSWLPDDYPTSGKIYFLLDVKHKFGSSSGVVEFIYDEFMHIKWCRSRQPGSSTFGSWYSQVNGRMYFPVAPGTNTIQSVVELANYLGQSDVFLKPGNHVITTFSGNGMTIGNGVRIIGTPDSVIVAESATGQQYYSPFYAGAGDFELIGVNITCTNVRYCVHDDPSSANAGTPARHVYRDCSFYIDNTQNNVWPNHQCIGGGLGIYTTIEVENCYFEAADPDSSLGLLSYHNNASANAKGLIFVKDCMFAGADGTARFGWYGDSTKITKCYVINSKMGTAPVIRAETAQSTNENMTLIAWGNVIES